MIDSIFINQSLFLNYVNCIIYFFMFRVLVWAFGLIINKNEIYILYLIFKSFLKSLLRAVYELTRAVQTVKKAGVKQRLIYFFKDMVDQ